MIRQRSKTHKRWILSSSVVFAALSYVFLQSAHAQNILELQKAVIALVKRTTPSVVKVVATRKPADTDDSASSRVSPFPEGHPFNDFFNNKDFRSDTTKSDSPTAPVGAGFILSDDGTIITSAKVTDRAEKIQVTLSDGRVFNARILGTDQPSGVAVIKLDADNLTKAELGDSDNARVGQFIIKIGHSAIKDNFISLGIVSSIGTARRGLPGYGYFMASDALTLVGDRGAPLIDLSGKTIGMVMAKHQPQGGHRPFVMAVPSNMVKRIATDIIAHGRVLWGLLGVNIQDTTPALAKSLGLSEAGGALISQVHVGKPAEQGGLRSGDVVLKFNEESVRDAGHLKYLIRMQRPGDKIKLRIFRDGKTTDVTVVLGRSNVSSSKKISVSTANERRSNPEQQGFEVGAVSKELSSKLGLKMGKGVLVTDVATEGLGTRLGLRAGDVILEVNSVPVTGKSHFDSLLSIAKQTGAVSLKVRRGKSRIFLAAEI